MRSFIVLTLGVVILAITLLPLHSQGVPAQKPAFEVASIKPNNSQVRPRTEYQLGGRFIATNSTLRNLIMTAYFIAPFQLSERSDWIDSDGYDVDAKPPANMIPAVPIDRETNAKIRQMLQALLSERFNLRMHWESKEMPVYALMVAKGGPKIRNADVNRDCRVVSNYCHGISGGPDLVTGHTVTMAELADALTLLVVTGEERRVIDKTGLQGAFDIELTWTPMTVPLRQELAPNGEPGPDPAGPSIFTALQEQLGLKLESAKGPVDVLVIDSAQKPSEN